ncbi:MAG: hypothetical protein C4542_05335 [Dehalococcoidia bacterium]|nr:MAG: hypothetical protein C4542_05335 [Dehalococcoidia bacterium]
MERVFTGIESAPSLDETVKIMDEMDRLLIEMKEMMAVIKGILGEEIEHQAHGSFSEDGIIFRPHGNVIHSS